MFKPKENKEISEAQKLQDGLALHERALADLHEKLTAAEAAYNSRGYELTTIERRRMGLDDSKVEMKIAATGEVIPSMGMILIPPDRTLAKAEEECQFLKGEIMRIEGRISIIRGGMKVLA